MSVDRLAVDAQRQLREGRRLAGLDAVIVHHVERIVALAHMQPGERAPGAANGVEGAPAQFGERPRLGERLARDAAGVSRRTFRGVHQGETAERQGHAIAANAADDVDEFERAAAEIADHAIGRVNGRNDSERGQLRLAPAGEQDDFAADRRARGVQKRRAVRRVARGRRGDHGDVVDLHRLAQRAKAAQSLQRLVDAILGESTAGDDALAERAHRLLVEDRRQRARQPLVGDEAH